MKTKSFLKKPCKKCGIYFLPNGHQNKICENCHNKVYLLLYVQRIKDSINRVIEKGTKYKEETWYKDLLKSVGIFDGLVKNLAFELEKEN